MLVVHLCNDMHARARKASATALRLGMLVTDSGGSAREGRVINSY